MLRSSSATVLAPKKKGVILAGFEGASSRVGCPRTDSYTRRYVPTRAAEIVEFRLRHELSSHMTLPRRPSEPVPRNSRGIDIRLDRLRKHLGIHPPCEPPLPERTQELCPER
jgi:hypothetical protein